MPTKPTFTPDIHRGWFRHLTRADEAALRDHLCRLSPEDRRGRFLHAVGDAFLAQHAAKLREPGYHVVGWFHDGTLRGVAEIAVDGGADRTAEAAFSVEAGWRNRGIGRLLMRRALRRARLCGAELVLVHTSPDNWPMIRVARAFGARIEHHDGELVCRLTPGPARLGDVPFDLVEDRIGLLAAGGELALSLVAAALPARPRVA